MHYVLELTNILTKLKNTFIKSVEIGIANSALSVYFLAEEFNNGNRINLEYYATLKNIHYNSMD